MSFRKFAFPPLFVLRTQICSEVLRVAFLDTFPLILDPLGMKNPRYNQVIASTALQHAAAQCTWHSVSLQNHAFQSLSSTWLCLLKGPMDAQKGADGQTTFFKMEILHHNL